MYTSPTFNGHWTPLVGLQPAGVFHNTQKHTSGTNIVGT